MAIVTRYVNFSTGTDDLAAGRGETVGDPWKSLSYGITQTASNSGNDVTIEMGGTAADTAGRIDGNGYVADSLTINAPAKSSAAYEASVPSLELVDVATAACYWRSTVTPLQINNLQIKVTQNTVNSGIILTSGLTGSAGVSFTNVYSWVVNNNVKCAGLIKPASGTGINKFVNCIVRLTGSVGTAARAFDSAIANRSMYNCLSHGSFDIGMYRIPVMTNCVSIGSADSYSTVAATLTTCFGDDSAGDAGVTNVTDWSTEYIDIANGDYSVKAGSTLINDGGTDVSAFNGGLSTDIKGTARSATWDGGPSELTAAAPVISLPLPAGIIGTQTSATLSCTTISSTGTLYGVIDSAGNISGITVSQVKLGNNNGDSPSISSNTSSVVSFTPDVILSNLSNSTLYSYALVQSNVDGDSNLLTGTFTTDALSLTITGPDSVLEGASIELTGTNLDTLSISDDIKLKTTLGGFSRNLLYGVVSANSVADVEWESGQSSLRLSGTVPELGVPLEPTITSANVTNYQLQVEVDNGVDAAVLRDITLNPDSSYEVIQVMSSEVNIVQGESIFGVNIVSVEDNHQVVVPKSSNGMNITWSNDGTFETDADQEEVIDALYLSPSTKEWSKHTLTIRQSSVDSTPPQFTTQPLIDGITATSYSVGFESNESGSYRYVSVLSGDPQPTPSEVLAGTGSGGSIPEFDSTLLELIADTPTASPATWQLSNTAYDIYLVIIDGSGNSTSSPVLSVTTLSTNSAPVILINPTDEELLEGSIEEVTFLSSSSGFPIPSVQWQKDNKGNGVFSNIVGSTSPSHTVLAVDVISSANNGDRYRAVYTNTEGSLSTLTAILTVTSAATSPIVTLDPTNESLVEGVGSITFSAIATGNPVPTVQWQKDTQGNGTFANISGATSSNLTVNGSGVTVLANHGDQYQAVFTNTAGVITTAIATLTVTSSAVAPTITTQPVPLAVNEGSGSVTFSVAYTGTAPITEQWQKDTKGNNAFSNVSSPTVNGSDVTEIGNDGDQYRVILTNSEGSVISDPAELTVTFVPPVVERIVVDEPTFYIGSVRQPNDNEEEVFTGYQNESEIFFLESGDIFDLTPMTRFQLVVNSVVVIDSDVDSTSFAWGDTLPPSKVTSTNLLLAKLGDSNLAKGTYYADLIAWRGTDKYVFTKERRLIMKVRTLT